jgi:chemotaxis protein methyltransferase CheR
MIYFSEPALHKAVENFAQCLRPGGLLFLGHSESIIGVSKSFEAIRVGNSIIYERVAK